MRTAPEIETNPQVSQAVYTIEITNCEEPNCGKLYNVVYQTRWN